MNIPSTIRAGDTLSWTESLPDYPAGDGWTLAINLAKYGDPTITITASTSGDSYAVSATAATTKGWVPGIYAWQAYVYKLGGAPSAISEKYTIEHGQLTVLPDITQATSATDLRSDCKKTLDAIEALLIGKATADVLSYSVAGRAIAKMAPTELLKWRDVCRVEYQRELDAERVAKGLDTNKRVGVRFRRV